MKIEQVAQNITVFIYI